MRAITLNLKESAMTSNMTNWNESTHHNGVRLECPKARQTNALSGFGRVRSELQHLVDQAVAAGADRRELANTPAFRTGVARLLAHGRELSLSSALLAL
jgi:hypothetical protein